MSVAKKRRVDEVYWDPVPQSLLELLRDEAYGPLIFSFVPYSETWRKDYIYGFIQEIFHPSEENFRLYINLLFRNPFSRYPPTRYGYFQENMLANQDPREDAKYLYVCQQYEVRRLDADFLMRKEWKEWKEKMGLWKLEIAPWAR